MIRAESLIREPMIRPNAWNTLRILCVYIHTHACIYSLLIYPMSAYAGIQSKSEAISTCVYTQTYPITFLMITHVDKQTSDPQDQVLP